MARRGASRRTRPATIRSIISSWQLTPAAMPMRRRSGFLEAGASQFAGQIPLILKLNNHDVLHDDKDPMPSVTGSVKDALRLGCVGRRLHDLSRIGPLQRDV